MTSLLRTRSLNSDSKGKRKANTEESSNLTKVPRKTLDAFFSPQATVRTKVPQSQGEVWRVRLNEEQSRVLRMVEEGKNVFYTGAAGTGKSLLLRAIISSLRSKHSKEPDVVSVTASTGMAASNIGGMTLHAWGAIAPNTQNVDTLISYIKKCKPALQRWKKTRALIIDEVSMVDGVLFQRLAELAGALRNKMHKPFGGIQLIVTGDFFQLPPVTKGQDPYFAFECPAWKEMLDHTIVLTEVFRQKDRDFIDLLNQLRQGVITPSATKIFTSLSRPIGAAAFPLPTPSAEIEPTELYPLRGEVDRANASRLASLPTKLHTFHSRDSGSAPADKRANLLANMMAQEKLDLKEGAQVMLIKNIDSEVGLVNGSVGNVLGFYRLKDLGKSGKDVKVGAAAVRNVSLDEDGKPVIGQDDEKENETESNRATKPKGKTKANEKDEELYPLILFPTCDGTATEAVLLMREEFRVEDNEGNLLARRMQMPLVLAWAMSIHKSQGQTIHRVKVDLGKVFEKGQSYVALSRAATLDGLQVLNFNPKKVLAHPKVIAWSKTLTEAGQP